MAELVKEMRCVQDDESNEDFPMKCERIARPSLWHLSFLSKSSMKSTTQRLDRLLLTKTSSSFHSLSSERYVCGATGRGAQRRHRRLVRARTIRTTSSGDRKLCCKAASLPFPPRDLDGHGVRSHNCGRNVGEDLSLRPKTAHNWPEGSRAMSEDSYSWIPRLEAVGGWHDGIDTAEFGEQRASNGGGSPRFRPGPQPISSAVNRTGLSNAPNDRRCGEDRSNRRDAGGAGDGHRIVNSSPRRPRTSRTMHRKLGKRPKWDERFWLGSRDITPAVRTSVEHVEGPLRLVVWLSYSLHVLHPTIFRVKHGQSKPYSAERGVKSPTDISKLRLSYETLHLPDCSCRLQNLEGVSRRLFSTHRYKHRLATTEARRQVEWCFRTALARRHAAIRPLPSTTSTIVANWPS